MQTRQDIKLKLLKKGVESINREGLSKRDAAKQRERSFLLQKLRHDESNLLDSKYSSMGNFSGLNLVPIWMNHTPIISNICPANCNNCPIKCNSCPTNATFVPLTITVVPLTQSYINFFFFSDNTLSTPSLFSLFKVPLKEGYLVLPNEIQLAQKSLLEDVYWRRQVLKCKHKSLNKCWCNSKRADLKQSCGKHFCH